MDGCKEVKTDGCTEVKRDGWDGGTEGRRDGVGRSDGVTE